MRKNLIIDSDFYKHTHAPMYAPGTTGLFSYAESRGGVYENGILFGLQAWIMDNLMKPITKDDVDYAESVVGDMGGFDRSIWDIVVNEYGGKVPVRIKAVKEGTVVPVQNALVTVESMDPRLASLTSFIETALIRLWYPTTIATKAYEMRKGINELYSVYADQKADPSFSLLDFGCRGVTCYEQAAIGGAAFLTSFVGTDTVPGVSYAREFYKAGPCGFSVKATEHSVMCSYGRENELASFKNLIENVAGNGDIISVVSDTWDIYKACEFWNSLAPMIYEKNIQLVVRPDSGEFKEVLAGMVGILQTGFRYHMNDKGYKVFDNLKILWADGISEKNYKKVLKNMPRNGFGVENLMLGSGGGLLQNVNRDTMKFAFKASAVEQGKNWHPIYKAPITDPGKRSKKGRVCLVKDRDGKFKTVDESLSTVLGTSQMEVVYECGELKREQTFEEIRNLIKEG